MVDIQTLSVAIASAGVLIGVAFYVWQIRHSNILRQTELTLSLLQQFTNKEFTDSWGQVMLREEKNYEQYVKKYGLTELFQISVFFEGVGILLHRKLMDKV